MKVLPAMLLILSVLSFAQTNTPIDQWHRVDHTAVARDTAIGNTVTIWGDGRDFWNQAHMHFIAPSTGDRFALAFSSAPLDTSYIRLWANNSENYISDCLLLDNQWPDDQTQQATLVTIHDTGRTWLAAAVGDLKTTFNSKYTPNGSDVRYATLAIVQRTADGTKHILATMLLPAIPQNARGSLAITLVGQLATAYWHPDGDPRTYYVATTLATVPNGGHSGLIVIVSPRHSCQGAHETARLLSFDF